MQIRVLGCAGSIAAGNRTTSFLVGRGLLVDAGTGVGDLRLDEMAAIDHILVSHSHLDHVLAIGLLADSVTRMRRSAGRPPVLVHALPPTIEALRTHIFNGVIWPDFTRLPSADAPVLAFRPIAVGQSLELAGRRVEVLPAMHTVPACGFAVFDAQGGAWVYSGDTGPNPALWQRLAGMRVRMLIVETAFRDEERELARISGHLHPQRLCEELSALTQPAEIYVTHCKPGELDGVMTQIAAQGGTHRVHALVSGQVLTLDERAPLELQP